jgi:hypothetical protein
MLVRTASGLSALSVFLRKNVRKTLGMAQGNVLILIKFLLAASG